MKRLQFEGTPLSFMFSKDLRKLKWTTPPLMTLAVFGLLFSNALIRNAAAHDKLATWSNFPFFWQALLIFSPYFGCLAILSENAKLPISMGRPKHQFLFFLVVEGVVLTGDSVAILLGRIIADVNLIGILCEILFISASIVFWFWKGMRRQRQRIDSAS